MEKAHVVLWRKKGTEEAADQLTGMNPLSSGRETKWKHCFYKSRDIWVHLFVNGFIMTMLIVSNQVVFPTRFLEGEDTANNFLFNADR